MNIRRTVAGLGTIAGTLLIGACVSTAPADPPHVANIETGRQVAQDICASCHAIGNEPKSPVAAAPPFGAILTTYDAETLRNNLQSAAHISHPRMPQIFLSDDHIEDLIAYMEDLQTDQ